MTCICSSRETIRFVFSKKLGTIGSKVFLYYLLFIYGNFSKRLKPNFLSSWFVRYVECIQCTILKAPLWKIFKVLALQDQWKLWLYQFLFKKIQHFLRTCFLTLCLIEWCHSDLFQITLFQKKTKTLVITQEIIKVRLYFKFVFCSMGYCGIGIDFPGVCKIMSYRPSRRFNKVYLVI